MEEHKQKILGLETSKLFCHTTCLIILGVMAILHLFLFSTKLKKMTSNSNVETDKRQCMRDCRVIHSIFFNTSNVSFERCAINVELRRKYTIALLVDRFLKCKSL